MKIDLKELTSKEFKKLQKDYDKIYLDIDLLSERERKYLKSIIDPYWGKVEYVVKKNNNAKGDFDYCLVIGVTNYENSKNVFEIKIPIIEFISEYQFEKLVLNHKYSQEDLFGEYLYTLPELVNNQEVIGIDCLESIKMLNVINQLEKLGVVIKDKPTPSTYDNKLRDKNDNVIVQAVITNKGDVLPYKEYSTFKEYNNKFTIYNYFTIDIKD